MGVFGRAAPPPGEPTPPTRSHLRLLRASGQRIDLNSRDSGPMVVATRQSWQKEAWAYRDMIGELRIAHRLLSRAVARVRFYPAVTRPWPQEPAPLDGDDHGLDPQLVADALHNFTFIPFDASPDGFTARGVENLLVAGEGWLHRDADNVVHVRSISEVTASADGRVLLNGLPNAAQGSTRTVDPATEDLMRIWVPHPEWAQLADSPMRSLLDVCEDVVLAGREQRAAARSRVAANGILLMPDSLSMPRVRTADEDFDELDADTFMSDFTAAMLAPISDDGASEAVVPIVIRGDKEDIAAVTHLTLERADSEQLIARQSSAVLRLLKGLDIQPEQVDGIGGMNHWGAFAVDARSVRDQVTPTAEVFASCLLQAFYRPALLSLGHDRAAVGRIVIACDVSVLVEDQNRGQDARDAHAALAISDESFREALGFGDDDKPDDPERLYRLAATGRLTPDLTAAVLGIGAPADRERVTVQGQSVPTRELPAAGPGPVGAPRTVPDLARGPIVAAAGVDDVDAWRVDIEMYRRLTDIDTALTDKIAVATDAAVARVLEKAGARTRNAARREPAITASLAGVETHLIPSRLGRVRVESFVSIPELLADAYTRLLGQTGKWLADSVDQVASTVVSILGLRPDSVAARRVRKSITSRMADRVGPAQQHLRTVLDRAAERAMFAPDPFNPDLELPGEGGTAGVLVRAREIGDVLTVAGGGSATVDTDDDPATPTAVGGPSGFASGPLVHEVLGEEGAVLLGHEWQYRPEIPRAHTFEPHRRLDGVRFATYTDPKLDTDLVSKWIGPYLYPGDHAGCVGCRAVPIWAVPELIPDPLPGETPGASGSGTPDGESIVARRLREAGQDPRNILARQVAADDDAAGRVGTSLQNEVEVRERITRAVQRLQRQHIDEAGS